jgi:hypothetical protein
MLEFSALRNHLIVSLIFCVFTGCNATNNPLASKRRNIICFVDLSASVTEAQRAIYVQAVEQVLKNMSSNDRLICYPIDAGSYSSPVKILNEDFKYATLDNITFPEAFRKMNKRTRDSIMPPFIKETETIFDDKVQANRIQAYVNAIMPLIEPKFRHIRKDNRFSQHSDIIHSVLNSEKDIEASDSYDLKVSNYFIFLSDMIHDDGTINFDKPYGISRSEGERVLQNLKGTNLIPDLKQTRIIIIGRSAGRKAKTPEAMENIKRFWEEYFSTKYANGGTFYYAGVDAISDIPRLLEFY